MNVPQRDLPRALLAGTLIVLVLYVALNAVFLYSTPVGALAGQLDVASVAGSAIFGSLGGRIVGAMICVGLISSISAMMWIGPRVMMTMGEDIPALRVFSKRSVSGAPAYAILFQLAVANLLLFTRSFEAVLDFIQFALLFCSFFTVAGVVKLRITDPDLPRPYRAWGYPFTPLVFLLVTAFMMYYLLTERPVQSLAGMLAHALGPVDLCCFPQAAGRRWYVITPRIDMFRPMRIAAVALALLAAAVSSARAADVTFDDTARFLAGMQPSPDSPLVPLTKDPGWQRHAKFFDGAFAQLEQRQLSKIRNWADVNLAAPRPTMFYLFSGPDFLYADAFYSKASTYVLGALEPVGAVPDLTRLPRGSVGAALYNVERSLGSILSFSFFITKHMKVDLHANQVNGTLPILYVFLARSGKTIRNVEMIALDDKGGVHTGGDNPGRNATRGVRITFAGSDGEARTLYYFSTDLSNASARNTGFLKFCETLGPGNSLLKSASYLLHKGDFSVARNWLLANSATIIQDDSGIPLANYNAQQWRFFPFGRYLGPIDEFPGRYQERYAELFTRAQPIDFGVGYRWRTHESNLLLSVRVPGSETAPAAETTSSAEPSPKPPRPKRLRPPESIPPPPGAFSGFVRLPVEAGVARSGR